MFRGADLTARNGLVSGAIDGIWKMIAYSQVNVASLVAKRAIVFAEVEDRFDIIRAFPHAAQNEADIIHLLKVLSYETGPNQYSYRYVEIVKDRITDPTSFCLIKQLLLTEDHTRFDRLILEKSVNTPGSKM